jgi:hypothetical protein
MRTLLAAAALGTMLVASVAAAAPGTPTQYVRKTSGPVLALAADGGRLALAVGGRRTGVGKRFIGCANVDLWEPARRRVVRFEAAAGCVPGYRTTTLAVAVAGTRVAWLRVGGDAERTETTVITATLGRRTLVPLARAISPDSIMGFFAMSPVGDRALLAITLEQRCSEPQFDPCPPGHNHFTLSSVWRIGGGGRCPWNSLAGNRRRRVGCSRVANADGELTVLAVDAGRIVVRTEGGIRLLTKAGEVVRDIPLRGVRKAALSGNQLAAKTAAAIHIYDAGSGNLSDRFPASSPVSLEDLDRDILVTASGGTVTLRRLGDGRTTTFHTSGVARAQLEPPGLFVVGGRRVAFTPMREVLRRLGG